MAHKRISVILCLLTFAGTGCGVSQKQTSVPAAPRPVTVMRLKKTADSDDILLTGSVSSWKTEKIGFEVAGRVRAVVEPELNIEGRVFQDNSNKLLSKGTVLARLNEKRYELAVDSATAQLDKAKRQFDAARVDLTLGLPARIQSAEAEYKLAKVKFTRTRNLVARGAASDEDLDKATADVATAKANVLVQKAALEAKKADIASLQAQAKQVEQSLAEAKTDRADCTLYSSFRGQVAEVHVVPGSYVRQGDPVVTVQMMDPIKIEVQVSAADSRRLRHRDILPYFVMQNDGTKLKREGLVYSIDTTADPQTRTFTVTILSRNKKVRREPPPELKDKVLARAEEIWPVDLDFLPEAGKTLLVVEGAIQTDDKGDFLWKVNNRKKGQVTVNASPILDVTQIRIQKGQQKIPFLGHWTFVPISIAKGEPFDPKTDLVVGPLEVSSGTPSEWRGDKILLDRERWLMRPGDLVRVDLFGDSQSTSSGFHVPMQALVEKDDKTYAFIVADSQGKKVARKVAVTLLDGKQSVIPGTTERKIAADGTSLQVGTSIIVQGAHYLKDGEPITIVQQRENQP